MKKEIFYLVLFLFVPGHYSTLHAQNAGDLDISFGSNGIVDIDLGDGANYCRSIAIQSDQKLVLFGKALVEGEYRPTLVRLNADSSLDESFGNAGIAIGDSLFDAFPHEEANALSQSPSVLSDFFVYPNPANEVLTLKWKNKTTSEQVNIFITDINGGIVWKSNSFSFNQNQIDTSQLSVGVYSITIHGNKTNAITQFVITR